MDRILKLKVIVEKCSQKKKNEYTAFIDLAKAIDMFD